MTEETKDENEHLEEHQQVEALELEDEPEEQTPIDQLRQALEQSREEAADLRDQLMRQVAEGENIRRRLEKEKAESMAYANFDFAHDMLLILDNFQRAIHALDDSNHDQEGIDSLIDGVRMTERLMLTTLQKYNISPVDALHKKFDPNYHEVVTESQTGEPGHITKVLQTGYRIKDRLLRPAMVIVASGHNKGGDSTEPGDDNVDNSDTSPAGQRVDKSV